MLPIVLAAVCFAPRLVVADADTRTLRRLDKALAEPSDKKAWFVRFEQQCPASDIPAWRRLQRRAASNSKQYGELSFALAYYGTDYAANLRRITRPSRLHNASYKAYMQEYGGPNHLDGGWEAEWTGWGQTWLPLNLLYLKHHDTASLQVWLDQAYDGCPAESSEDELSALWKRHKVDLLRAAGSSSPRAASLADALTYNCYSPRSIRTLLHETRVLARSEDGRVAAAAQRIAGQVQRHVKEVDDFDKNNKAERKKVGQAAPSLRRAFADCALPLAYDKGDLEELSVAISARPLGADELRGLSDADLILLRNVPFARHGYRFRNPKLLDYFSNKSWYRPNTDSDSAAERRCSRIENRNVNAIIAFQKRQRGDTSGAAMQGSGMGLPALMTAVSERNLGEGDLNGKTAWQLTLLRNTPYARHGFRFGSAKLTNYFRGKAWYRPDSSDQDVVSGRFNPFERRNIKFIADYQDANGLRDMP